MGHNGIFPLTGPNRIQARCWPFTAGACSGLVDARDIGLLIHSLIIAVLESERIIIQ